METRLYETVERFLKEFDSNLYTDDIPLSVMVLGKRTDVESVWIQHDERQVYIHCGNSEFEGDLKVASLSDENISNIINTLEHAIEESTIEKLNKRLMEHFSIFHADMITRAVMDKRTRKSELLNGLLDIVEYNTNDGDDDEFTPKVFKHV